MNVEQRIEERIKTMRDVFPDVRYKQVYYPLNSFFKLFAWHKGDSTLKTIRELFEVDILESDDPAMYIDSHLVDISNTAIRKQLTRGGGAEVDGTEIVNESHPNPELVPELSPTDEETKPEKDPEFENISIHQKKVVAAKYDPTSPAGDFLRTVDSMNTAIEDAGGSKFDLERVLDMPLLEFIDIAARNNIRFVYAGK